MTREEIIALLECPKEDAITHFNDDGDDGTFCSDVEDIEAVIAAFRQQQEQESKPLNGWISVKDRLPEKDENYIVTVCDEGCSAGEGIWYSTVVVVAEYYKGSWTWYDGGHEYSLDGIVTHWMPMPNPPKGE